MGMPWGEGGKEERRDAGREGGREREQRVKEKDRERKGEVPPTPPISASAIQIILAEALDDVELR